MELLTYEQVLSELGKSPTLLLGNGFSMAYDANRFSFTHLLDEALREQLITEQSSLYQVFKYYELSDFEEVIRMLEDAAIIAQKYNLGETTDLQKDAKNLKKYLVKIITNNHPEKITDIAEEKYLSCSKFISRYSEIYTLNYDLLLYWTTMKLDEFRKQEPSEFGSLQINDGFGNDEDNESRKDVVYKNDSSCPQKIHYLHGALHIFDKGNKIVKNTYSRTGEILKNQTYRNLLKDIYPVFISEGKSEMKEKKIIHNALLNHEYKSLIKKSGDLVIYGTILKSNDEHIKKAILDGGSRKGFKRIFIGVFSDEDHQNVSPFKAQIEDAGKKCILYDSKTVNPWG